MFTVLPMPVQRGFALNATLALLLGAMVPLVAPVATRAAVTDARINEFVANHTGTDTNEYVEVVGPADTDLSDLTILQVEGDTTGAGVIDSVLPVGSTDADGFWVTGPMGNELENGTITLLLVDGFAGADGDDLDTNNDGTLDATPWAAIVDAVAVSDGGSTDRTYGGPVLSPGYDGVSLMPGGASRIPDGSDTDSSADWVRNDFDGAGLPGFDGTLDFGEAYNTPGGSNEVVPPPAVVISEVYGGGGNDDAQYTHDFIELFNPTESAVDLTGWSVQYADARDEAWDATPLEGSVPANGYFLIQQAVGPGGGTDPLPTPDTIGDISMGHASGKVALVASTTPLDGACPIEVDPGAAVDFVGYGSANCHEGDGAAPQLTNTTAAHRAAGGATDTDDNAADFTAALPTPQNSTVLPDPFDIVPIGEVQGSVSDTDDGRTHRAADAPGSAFSCSFFDDAVFTVQGVVTQLIRTKTSDGDANFGFFLQNTTETADDDPNSSDGIFIFTSGFETVFSDDPDDESGFFEPQVGDEIVLEGGVQEFFNFTQLCRVTKLDLVATDRLGATEVTEADPPDDLADAYRFWERHEGMRFEVPAGSQVIGGRSVFGSTADAEVWVIRGDHPVAQRTDPYTDRVFRDPHPLDNVPGQLFDDGNGYRIMLTSHGLKWLQNDSDAMLAPARTFDTVHNTITGSLYFSFGKYGIEAQQQLDLSAGADPSENAPPPAPDRAVEYSTAVYNVENLYDFRDDPFDGCDFNGPGNPGCLFDPEADGGDGAFRVEPPYDYVPPTDEAYRAQLADLADQIVSDLHAPDILLIQETEDQDVCTVDEGALVCDLTGAQGTNDADGKPDSLQELALTIETMFGIPYDAAFDRDGADDRGIVNAFLFRTDRVELLPADASHPVLGSDPQVAYAGAALAYNADVQNPKALNAELPAGVEVGDTCDHLDIDCVFTRDPLVGHFRVWRDGIGTSAFTDLYAISNHFSSNPQARVAQRTEQAAYNAAIVDALATADDGDRVLVGGDFNVFPRPDDPFNPPNLTDQLAPLYDADLADLWAVVVSEAPESAYSYVFEGQAQTLDNQFTTELLFDELNGVRFAHINADFPAEYGGDGSRGASDHDPQAARFSAATPSALMNLVEYLLEAGAIDASKAEQLLSRLAGIDDLADDGNVPAARAQLQAFGNQVDGLSPRWIEPDAAEILQLEAEVLADAL